VDLTQICCRFRVPTEGATASVGLASTPSG